MNASPVRRTAGDWASLLTLVVFWGSTFALTKIAVGTIPPVWIVCIRLWIALAVVLLALRWRGEALPDGLVIWAWLAPIAALAVTPFALITWGTQHIDTGLGGILIGAVPIFVAALAHFVVPGESMTLSRAAGVLLGFAGVILLVDPNALYSLGGDGLAIWAQLAIVAAAFCYAVQGICARVMPDASAYQKSAGMLIIAAPVMLPFALIMAPDGLAEASFTSILATIAIGLFPTALAGVVMFRLTARAGPTFVSLSSYLIPVFAVGLGAIAFGEVLELRAIQALFLILVGIALSEWRSRNAGNRNRH